MKIHREKYPRQKEELIVYNTAVHMASNHQECYAHKNLCLPNLLFISIAKKKQCGLDGRMQCHRKRFQRQE